MMSRLTQLLQLYKGTASIAPIAVGVKASRKSLYMESRYDCHCGSDDCSDCYNCHCSSDDCSDCYDCHCSSDDCS